MPKKIDGEGVAGQRFRESGEDQYKARVPLPIVGNTVLNLPAYFMQKMPDKKTKDGVKPYWKLVSPTTAVRNLSTRKKQNSIQIITGNKDEEPSIENRENLELPKLYFFSPKDQTKIKELFANMFDATGNFKDYSKKNKTRGLPELLPKNIEYHTRQGTSKIKKVDLNTSGEKLRNMMKGKAPAKEKAKSPEPAGGGGREPSFSLINPDDLPQGKASRAKTPTPRAKTPKSARSSQSDYSPTLSEFGLEDFGLATPDSARNSLGFGSPFSPQSGRGISETANSVYNFVKKVVNPSSAIPPNLQAIKKEFGNESINRITVCRAPVPATITSAMNIVSLGGFHKVFGSLPYDSLFHLYIIINTNKGDFLLEKNERINATKRIPSPKGLETKQVSISSPLTVNSLLDNTERKMGSAFYPYSPSDNNCQDFITNVLQANNLLTQELRDFVKQNTDEIFKQNPTLAKISRGLTDLGASINVIQQGGSINSAQPKLKSMNNIYHMLVLHHLIPQGEKQVKHSLGMMGGSILDDIGKAFRPISAPVERLVRSQIPAGVSVGNLKRIANMAGIPTDVGGAKRIGKIGIDYALPAIGSTLGETVGMQYGGEPGKAVGATLGKIAGRIASEQAAKAIDGSGVRRRGRPRKMSGQGWLSNSGILDRSFTARDIIKGAKALPKLAKEAGRDISGAGLGDTLEPASVIGKMSGQGWLSNSGILDKPVTARDIIKGAKALPKLAKEAGRDISGAGVKRGRGRPKKMSGGNISDLVRNGLVGSSMPKRRGITSGIVDVPGVSSGIVTLPSGMGGSGVKGRPAKGSPEMKERMARLRSMKKK